MGGTALLGSQQVDGHDDAHQQRFQEIHYALDAACGHDHHGLGLGQGLFFQPGGGLFIGGVHLVRDPALHRRIALQQALYPAADNIVVVLHIADQLEYALIQLRQQHRGQQIEQHTDDRPGHQQAHRPDASGRHPALLPGLPYRRGKQVVLEKIHHRRQQIGDEGAVENRLQCRQKLPSKPQRHVAAKEGVIKQQDRADRCKYQQSLPHILVLALHGPPPLWVLFYMPHLGIAILILPCYTIFYTLFI